MAAPTSPGGPPWYWKIPFGVAAGGTVILALILLALIGHWRHARRHGLVSVVVAARPVPAGACLSPEDVTAVRQPPPAAGFLSRIDDATGRIARLALRQNEIVRQSALAPLPADDLVLTVPTPALPALARGSRVSLLGTRRETDHAEVVTRNGIVLEQIGRQTLVAVTAPEAQKAVRYLLPNERLAVLPRARAILK